MENQMPTSTPGTMPPTAPAPNGMEQKPEAKGGSGALIGSIIIIIILVAGGLYFFNTLKNTEVPIELNNTEELAEDELEAELDAAFDADIDSELSAIEAEIDAALVE